MTARAVLALLALLAIGGVAEGFIEPHPSACERISTTTVRCDWPDGTTTYGPEEDDQH